MCTAAEAKYDRVIGASGRVWLIAKKVDSEACSPLVMDPTGEAGIMIDGQRYWLSNYSDAFNETMLEVCRERAAAEHLCVRQEVSFSRCPACNIGAPGAAESRANILDTHLAFAV